MGSPRRRRLRRMEKLRLALSESAPAPVAKEEAKELMVEEPVVEAEKAEVVPKVVPKKAAAKPAAKKAVKKSK